MEAPKPIASIRLDSRSKPMTLFKSVLAGAAASALIVSQAAAAPSVPAARIGTPVGLGILVTGDDDEDPVSP